MIVSKSIKLLLHSMSPVRIFCSIMVTGSGNMKLRGRGKIMERDKITNKISQVGGRFMIPYGSSREGRARLHRWDNRCIV